jgi:ubiquinone/menaquinone biosynthesis C-methylase UbiE
MDNVRAMKTAMSGQKIPFIHRLSSSWKIFRAYQTGIFGKAEVDINLELLDQLTEIILIHLKRDIKNLKILDIGCGQKAAQTILLKAEGADIVGIDMEIPTYDMTIKTFFQVIMNNGMERAIKSLLRHILFDRRFFVELSERYGKKLFFDDIDIRRMNAANLSFPDNTFDFIFSAWSFEHFDNVPAAVSEVNRVLKPSGIAWIAVHLFPSLSGGHNIEWLHPDKSPSSKVPPWDHLMDNKYPVNTYLNKLRLIDYNEILHRYMNVFDEQLAFEGEELLAPEIENILRHKGYSREDLLARTVTFLCKKTVSRQA